MKKITIYTASNCPYCHSAKLLLKKRQIPFEEIEISPQDGDSWEKLSIRSGMKTVPQIFHGEKLIGGFNELSALDNLDGLSSLHSPT